MRFIFSFPFGRGWGEDGMGHVGSFTFVLSLREESKLRIEGFDTERKTKPHATAPTRV